MNDTTGVGEGEEVNPTVASDQDFSQLVLANYNAFLEPATHEVVEAPTRLVQLVLDQLPSSKVSSGDEAPSLVERRLEKTRGPRLWKVMALAASTLLIVGVGGFAVQTLGETGTPSETDMASGATDEVVPGLRGDAGTEGIDGAQLGELAAGLLILDLPAANSEEARDRVSRIWVPDTAPAAAGYSIIFVPETPSGTIESQARTFCTTTGDCIVATIPTDPEVGDAAGTSVKATIDAITNSLQGFESINLDGKQYWLVDGAGVDVVEMQTDLPGIRVVTSLGDVQ
ncbi:MAG: hypothetical protein WAO33_04210 [Candidatus Nanopelagicales bacterium]|jgi:hypothetical protein|nr:hypothetical protein [Actinomycetes bacterium]MCH9738953.1 hypothetical protein [Actinomycetes bacterium]MCH9839926.1 hypothetical protein [Actinomycetes bacterium]